MSDENTNQEITPETIPFPGTAETTPRTESVEVNDLNEKTLTISPALVINALKCIDAGANRGAYQGGELSSVGGVRDQLYAMVAPIVEEMSKQAKEKLEAK